MPFLAVDHPMLACRDVAKLADWYCTVLGMHVIARAEAKPSCLVGYGTELGTSAAIEMTPARDPGLEPASVARFAPGFRHVAICVSDFDEAYAALKNANVVFTTEPHEAMGGGKTVLFRDPEGNELQIIQRTKRKY
jgi:catechol 2,3-dioxygenase-like lactoylglutathione lyase family enzyme